MADEREADAALAHAWRASDEVRARASKRDQQQRKDRDRREPKTEPRWRALRDSFLQPAGLQFLLGVGVLLYGADGSRQWSSQSAPSHCTASAA